MTRGPFYFLAILAIGFSFYGCQTTAGNSSRDVKADTNLSQKSAPPSAENLSDIVNEPQAGFKQETQAGQ